MPKTLIDTDILSYFLKGYPEVVNKLEAYEQSEGPVFISRITVVEVLGGLKAKNAERQEAQFRKFISTRQILEIGERTGEIAAVLIAFLYQNGLHSGSYDILIAATALENELVLCTNNTKDYQHLPGIQLANWKSA